MMTTVLARVRSAGTTTAAPGKQNAERNAKRESWAPLLPEASPTALLLPDPRVAQLEELVKSMEADVLAIT